MATSQQATQVMNGADILVKSLVDHGVEIIFAYPGGASMPLHQALTRYADRLRTILPRHEQGGGFAAQGYARSTGRVGVCMATSGPGATNLVTAIADAKLDSIPMVAITGQVSTAVIGKDAFQETPVVEVCRGITKHHHLVTDVQEIPRVMKEAFHIVTTGRPGPVLVDMPKNVQITSCVPDWDQPMKLPGYRQQPFPKVRPEQIRQVAAAIKLSKRPVIYAGGGIVAAGASDDLRTLVKKTGIPVTTTVMGLGVFPGDDPLSLDMLGMHGSVYANYAVDQCDLLVALGVRFDDRVTGKTEEFAKHAKIIHIDIDASEINKNKEAHLPIVGDVKNALHQLNEIVEPPEIEEWVAKCQAWKQADPFTYDRDFSGILQQHAIDELCRITAGRDTYITVGVGQHQMWAAQFYKFKKPRTWLSSSGLGTMGFGLPAAMGVQAAHPGSLVIDIDGDGSFQMNVQELATCFCEKLPVKIMLLNNQHLGMVVQWEDRFEKGNRAHTYLGPIDDPEAQGKGGTAFARNRYPDFVAIAKGYGCGAASVSQKAELTDALEEMIRYDGPFLLDVEVPYQEHVLPMIPSGGSVQNLIKE